MTGQGREDVEHATPFVSDQRAVISELACFGIPRVDGKWLETRSDHDSILERRPSTTMKRENERDSARERGSRKERSAAVSVEIA